MGVRHRARERALQALYEWEATRRPLDVLLRRFWSVRPEDSERVVEFAERLVRGTVAEIECIDEAIARQAEHWRLERMGQVDRNILRLGAYELLHEPETPPAVVIDEAIELAKRYSGDQAGHFVNGILDGIRRRLEAGEGVEAVGGGIDPAGGRVNSDGS